MSDSTVELIRRIKDLENRLSAIERRDPGAGMTSVSTDAGVTRWQLGDYTVGVVVDTGSVTVTINGVAYQFLVKL